MKYVYIATDEKCLQGDRIETPSYINKWNLEIDYEFYVTNQIMRPVLQIFALEGVLEEMPGYDLRRPGEAGIREAYENDEAEIDLDPGAQEKYNKRIQDLRARYARDIILDDLRYMGT